MTDGRPVKRNGPAGWSPFAGIARIRSLGVAVQPRGWTVESPMPAMSVSVSPGQASSD